MTDIAGWVMRCLLHTDPWGGRLLQVFGRGVFFLSSWFVVALLDTGSKEDDQAFTFSLVSRKQICGPCLASIQVWTKNITSWPNFIHFPSFSCSFTFDICHFAVFYTNYRSALNPLWNKARYRWSSQPPLWYRHTWSHLTGEHKLRLHKVNWLDN